MTGTRATRKPTGLPSWPIGLLTGPEKSGKTFQAAKAATSELIGGTYWVGIGEDDPDEYGAFADFDIVQHDGTYRDFLGAVDWAVAQPPMTDGKPNLIVMDSGTRLWDLICDDLQDEANARERRKAARSNRAAKDGDQQITMDLWNTGKQRWNHVLDTLREHEGPVLITARLDTVTVMDDRGQPTTQKETKVKAEKSLPYEVGFIVEFPVMGEAVLTGVRSLRVKAAGATRKPLKDFTVDKLWHDLGLADEVGARTHSPAGGERPNAESIIAAIPRADLAGVRRLWQVANHHGLLTETDDDGAPIQHLIDARVAHLRMLEEMAAEAEASIDHPSEVAS